MATPLVAAVLLCFYLRYVPLAGPFQIALVPFLAAGFLFSAWNSRLGLLFFTLTFPLINSLPYFFGIDETVPHAPAALVLFLFSFLGWLVHHCTSRPTILPRLPILRPLLLFAAAVSVSGIITFFRYANFFPFRTDHVYELTVNATGVSAGGAIMSVVFTLLNTLTGLAFFLVLVSVRESREDVQRLLSALMAAGAISIVFGLVQHSGRLELGNHPISLRLGLVNGTFQDALAFGAFLSVVLPVGLAAAIAFRGPRRWLAGLVFLGGLFILPQTGSKSGLISAGLALVLFLVFATRRSGFGIRSGPRKKAISVGRPVFLLVLACLVLVLALKDSAVLQRIRGVSGPTFKGALEQRWNLLWKSAGMMILEHPVSGIGLGSYVIERPNFQKLSGASFWYSESAEDYFLHQGAELGLIGLFLILWVFWHVFREAAGSVRRPLNGPWPLIRLGAACGIISHFLNLLVHTFAGTVEVWYGFWFLAGVLFVLAAPEEVPEKKLSSGVKAKLGPSLLILVYGATLLWSSTHSLSLPGRTERLKIPQTFGLYPWEKEARRHFRWMGRRAAVTLRATGPVAAIPLLASHPDLAESPVQVKIYLVKNLFRDKRLLDEVTFQESAWKTRTLDIHEEKGQDITFLFEVSRTWNPRQALHVPDPRNLGAALGVIYFQDKTSLSP